MKKHDYIPTLPFLLLLILSVSFTNILTAQNTNNEPCHTDVLQNMIQQQNPTAAAKKAAQERRLQDFLDAGGADRSDYLNGAIITIPVVFHILWNTTEQNIDDEYIHSQLAVLNEEYRKQNPDTTLIPSLFKPLAGDARIEFCLATRMPNGAPMQTPGITRTQTDVASFATSGSSTYEQRTRMHFNNKGGKNIWDRDSYLNVWVCNLDENSGTLAWAYLPGADDEVDGIVCRYNYLGRPTIAGEPYHLGRTMTHEIGHWLNLEHTFGNAENGACSDDFVADTPSQSAANFGCPTFPTSTCNNDSDMYMNFMDYANDACTQMFTLGQIERMRASLYLMRPELLNSLGCSTILENDARAVAITGPEQNYCFTNTIPISASILNTGSNTLESLEIHYTFNDDPTVFTSNWTGSLASGESADLFVGISPPLSDDLHKLTLYTVHPNGQADPYPQTDTVRTYISVGQGLKAPFYESFEEPYTHNGWWIKDVYGMVPWHQLFQGGGNTITTGVMGIRHGFHDYFEAEGSFDNLNSPTIDLSNIANAQLQFNVSYYYDGTLADELNVYISNNCGTSYENLYSKQGEDLATRELPTPQTPSDWRTEIVDLSDYDGGEILLNFQSKTAGGNWLMLDNVSVTGDIISTTTSTPNLAKPTYQLHPNVAQNITYLHLFNAQTNIQKASIQVLNVKGQVLVNQPISLVAGNNLTPLDISGLASGMYLVKVKLPNQTLPAQKLYKL